MATSVAVPAPVPEARRSELSVIPEQRSESSVIPAVPAVPERRTELPVVHEEYLPGSSIDFTSVDSLALPKTQDAETGLAVLPAVSRRRRDAFIPGFRDRSSFRDWLRHSWLDIATTLLCIVLSGALWLFARPLLPRSFPLYTGIETSAWGLKHSKPYQVEWITTATSALVSFLVPLLVISSIGLWGVRRFWETNAAIMGLGYALATTTLIVSVIKWVYGGLRPHFLAVCQPVIPPSVVPVYYTIPMICSGGSFGMREVQMSFPSGHAAAAFAGFRFLALYLNAKYKVFGPRKNGDGRRISHWKLIMFVLPWLTAVLIAASKIRDGWHHPVDVVAGAVIGTILAHLAFKMVFRSVYDSRDNHVPRE